MTNLDRLLNISDMERAARRHMPVPLFEVIAGGAGDELTLRANQEDFKKIPLRSRSFVDVRTRDLSTTVLGQRIDMPIMLAPIGYQRMIHGEAELASARGAAAAGTIYACNTISSYPLEEVAAASDGPKWFQLYMPSDRDETDQLLTRVEAAGYPVLCLTVDTPMLGMRERDIRNRITQPLKVQPRLVLAAARRPRWSMDFLRGGAGRGMAPTGRLSMSIKDAGKAMAKSGRPITYDDLAWLRERWKGKLVVKGILRSEDCNEILDHGVDGIVVSNHGGRQLDTSPSSISVLPEIVDAVAGRAEVYVDGGIRRGTDVVKALCLGARAVLIGRPYLFGLAAGGQAGVERVLEIFREELDTAVGLVGCSALDQLDRSLVAASSHDVATTPSACGQSDH